MRGGIRAKRGASDLQKYSAVMPVNSIWLVAFAAANAAVGTTRIGALVASVMGVCVAFEIAPLLMIPLHSMFTEALA